MAFLARDAHDLAIGLGGTIPSHQVHSALSTYKNYHTIEGGDEKIRKANYADMANKYYDLVTSFYEYGWGQSFHFADRLNNESFRESIKRYEHYIGLRLGLQPGMKVLDVGCGIGGPLREIAAFSGASITGLNNNEYQIKRGIEFNKRIGLHKTCDFLKADFMKIPKPDNTYDAIYTIEAVCHAPDLVAILKELKRVLKPGQLLAGYDWCMTNVYDSMDPSHNKVKAEIEIGSGLPDIRTTNDYFKALKEAGFEIIMGEDMAIKSPLPWYEPLNPRRLSLSSFRTTSIGRFFTRNMVWLLELAHFAPEGSLQVSNLLEKCGDAIVEGGRLKIFTPMFFFLVRKPKD